MGEKRLVVVTPVEWHHVGDAPKFLVWDDGSWPGGDELDRIAEAVNERDQLREAAQNYLDAIKTEHDLRQLGNTEGIARVNAGAISAREYKRGYYAPAIRAQFAVDEARHALVAALTTVPADTPRKGGE